MGKLIATLFSILFIISNSSAQHKDQKVFTSDIDNFWQAYDSIQTTKDSAQQLHFIQSLYIDKGTEGLKAFMEARDYSAEMWVKLINKYPRFWSSIRPNTLSAKSKAKEIEASIKRLKKLYPELKEAKMYFAVGGINSGGTTMDNLVLIGTEIATGTAQTDVSDLPSDKAKWLTGVFKEQKTNNIVPLNIHEYIHTQQKGEPDYLLGHAIKEGSCDFMTELVMREPMPNNYIQYGRAHEQELKEKFKEEMFSTAYSNWLYNGTTSTTIGDLGYFMGYTICKSYYNNASDKKQAIKDIININYSDSNAIESFLLMSKYYTEPIIKSELLKNYEAKRSYVIKLEPFNNGDTLVDTSIKELRIVFSAPMSTNGYSINNGPKGKDYSPIVGVVGFSEDKTAFTLKIDLKPNHEYEFIVTDRGFKSADGYPIKPYVVKFKTEP